MQPAPGSCFFPAGNSHSPLSTPSQSAGAARVMPLTPSKPRQPIWATWLHEHLFRERAIMLSHALDNSTMTTYSSHLQSYLTFCKLHDFLLEPSADTLSFYIVFMAHHIKPNSVSQYISGIISSLKPHFPNVHDIHNGLLMSHTLAGIRKL